MKIKKVINEIKDSLEGDKLNLFLHEENSLKREIDLCKNRLSVYFTFLLFFFGWIISLIYQFVDLGIIDGSALVSETSKGLTSGRMIPTTFIGLITISGVIKDVFLLMSLKEDRYQLIKKWGTN